MIHEFLCQRSFWAKGRTLDVARNFIENPLCFGVFSGDQQVGFARVVTDYATFSWLCDVFILETHSGRGLAKWLVSTIVEFPGLRNAKRFLLASSDAHDLYAQYGGFEMFQNHEKLMVRTRETQSTHFVIKPGTGIVSYVFYSKWVIKLNSVTLQDEVFLLEGNLFFNVFPKT